jgi:hypothetical protein
MRSLGISPSDYTHDTIIENLCISSRTQEAEEWYEESQHEIRVHLAHQLLDECALFRKKRGTGIRLVQEKMGRSFSRHSSFGPSHFLRSRSRKVKASSIF